MSAGRLFAKIFLWFWLANTLAIGALALVIWLYPYTGRPHPGTLEDLHTMQARGALAVLEAEGPQAFDRHAQALEEASALRTYWLDAQGRELRGHTVPDRLLRELREYQAAAARGEPPRDQAPPHPLVLPLRDARGAAVFAVAEPLGAGQGPYVQQLVSSRVFLPRVLTVVLTAGLGCYALARYLTKPVRRLQYAARRLAAGDLSVHIDQDVAGRRDEIGDLGRDFERMARQVEGLLTTQKRLLQDVSHELRSPLARLNVALEIALRDAGPAASAALARAGREADRLNELIRQLLMLARLEGGGPQPQQVGIDLAALVAEVAADADFEAAARGRGVRLVQCDAAVVLGTPDMLRSAIENVTRNAVHHTPGGTDVEIGLRWQPGAAGGVATIKIRDRGPGVPAEALDAIFRPFYRVSTARERVSGGIGLGLAIAQRAIRLHGGEVFASNAPEGGLAVRIELPCVPQPPPEPPA